MATLPFTVSDCVSGRLGFDMGYYRIIVDSSTIKYLAFDDLITLLPDFRGEYLAFSTVPAGEWNLGRLKKNPSISQFSLDSTETVELKGIQDTWHKTFIDWNDLSEPLSGSWEGELQCMGKMYSAVFEGHLGFDKVVVDFDWYPLDVYGPDHNTAMYALVEGHGIAPKFIAHVTENKSRVIGYMTEKIFGRAAAADDLPACQAVLKQLHALGIMLRFLAPENFIVVGDRVYIHGFGGAYQTNDSSVLAKELGALAKALGAT